MPWKNHQLWSVYPPWAEFSSAFWHIYGEERASIPLSSAAGYADRIFVVTGRRPYGSAKIPV